MIFWAAVVPPVVKDLLLRRYIDMVRILYAFTCVSAVYVCICVHMQTRCAFFMHLCVCRLRICVSVHVSLSLHFAFSMFAWYACTNTRIGSRD